MDATSLPLLRNPHDSVREGLVTLKDGAKSGHPVEQVQLGLQSTVEESKMEMLRNVYGSGLPARMQIERQILERAGRLPGLTSSRLGLDSMSGALEEFAFEDYIGLPSDSEAAQPDIHSLMEQHLGIASTTKPCKRGLL